MKKKSFGDFIDKQKRELVRKLKIIKEMLEHAGLKVESFLESGSDNDPYIFCHNPLKKSGVDGIRIYEVGDTLAFRVQKQPKTHPYGAAYALPIESMFHDFLSDDKMDEEKAAKRVVESTTKEVQRFFEKTEEAEKKDRENSVKDGNVMIRSTGTDYSNMIYSR